MTRKTRRTKYPWEEWTSGERITIYRGEQYTISTYHLQISLHGHARSRGLTVQTRSFTERGRDAEGYVTQREGLTFQFNPKETSNDE